MKSNIVGNSVPAKCFLCIAESFFKDLEAWILHRNLLIPVPVPTKQMESLIKASADFPKTKKISG